MSTDELVVAAGNEGQAAAWDGNEGRIWAAHAEFFDAGVRDHHARLLEAAVVQPGEAVLDVGCGNGQVALDLAPSAAPGAVLGIDLSAAMLRNARRAAASRGLANVRFVQGDAQQHPFDDAGFDVAVSRFGSMFFSDPVAAFTNIRRALRPGGRLVLASWQAPAANEWFTTVTTTLRLGEPLTPPPPSAPSPFAHADPARVGELLADAGFAGVACEPVEAPMYFGRDAAEALERITELMGWLLEGHTAQQREQAVADLQRAFVERETPQGVALRAASWIVTATAA